MKKDAYEPEPGMGFDYEEWEQEQRLRRGSGCEVEYHENPYEDYQTFDVEVTETAKKIIHVWAKDAESAKEYLGECLEEIDMEKDIDEYDRKITLIEESGQSGADYTVPLEWYE